MTTAPSLPAGTTLGRSYEYGIDLNLGTPEAPIWQPVRRISDFQPTPTPISQPSQTYDDFGSPNEDVVAWAWAAAFAVQVNRSTATGRYLPEVEALMQRTRPEAKGDAAVIEARWYHKPESGTPNPDDALQGRATVAVQRGNIGSDGATETINVTLTGKGPGATILNPFTGWDVGAPVVQGVTPDGALSGDLVTLTGVGFVGATAVTFNALPADDFQVMGGSTIAAILPTDTAGEVPVVVTTPGGASAAFTYTRGA